MTRIRRQARLVLVTLAAVGACMALASPASAQDSKGTDFWLGFPGNFSNQELKLFIAGDTVTSGTVSIPGAAFIAPFSVTPGTVTTVDLPNTAQMQTSDAVQDLGVHVTALNEVTVYGLNRRQASTDAYLGLPTDALGTDYINIGYRNSNIVNANQLGVVASQNATTVTITPSVTVGTRTAGIPYTVSLNQGQTYLLRDGNSSPSDLTGTIITSDKPIAVYGGHQCANIPGGVTACDHIVEQLPPTTQWGQNFLSMPLATRLNGDTFRILASANSTEVKVNGTTVATLNRGQFHEQLITGPAQITADKPVLVMQYSNGTSFDSRTGDPFQMMIPPFEQYLANYTVSTSDNGFNPNYINVVAPNSAVGSVKVDGTNIPPGDFTPIGSSGFSGAQVLVGLGSHTVTSPQPIGVHSYGFGSADSYGYPGGLSLAQVATVSKVDLTPKTATNQVNTQHCVTAKVTDTNSAPVEGVRVDFEVSGANTASGFDFTNASGEAEFCYTGTNLGDDSIKGTVGRLSDTVAKTWVQTPPSEPSISINDVSVVEGPAGSTIDAVFTLTRTGDTTGSSSVVLNTEDGTATVANNDYQPRSGVTVNFAATETSKTVAVTVNGDNVPENTETFKALLSAPTNATIADGEGIGTIQTDMICPPGQTDPDYCVEVGITLRSGVAFVPVTCPEGAGGVCSGKVELRTAHRVRASARGKRVTLGAKRYRVKAGHTRRVKVKLSRKGMRTLKRYKRLRVDVISRGDRRARSVVRSSRLGTYTLRYKRR